MARKLSIALAVVLAIFAVSPNLGHAQGRGLDFAENLSFTPWHSLPRTSALGVEQPRATRHL